MNRVNPAAGSLGAMKLLGDSFRLLFANFALIFPLALAPALLIEALMLATMPAAVPEDPSAGLGAAAVIALLLATAIGYMVTAVLCVATVDILAGTRRPLAAHVAVATRNIVPLVVIGVLVSVAVALGIIALILPGLYIYAQFFVWIPCVVLENRGMAGIGRAQALTRGHRWPIVGAMVVMGMLFLGLFLLVAPLIAAGFAATGSFAASLVSALLQAMSYAMFGVFTTLVYVRLRALEDGTGPEALSRGVA